MEPIEAILLALTEEMKFNSLYEKSLKYRPNMSKSTFTKTIKEAKDDGTLRIKSFNGREIRISYDPNKVEDFETTKLRYRGWIDTNIKNLNYLKKVSEASDKEKKKFIIDEKFYVNLLVSLDTIMSCQKCLLFDIQSEKLLKSHLYLLKGYVTEINNNLNQIYKLLKKIDIRYYNIVISSLQKKLNQEFIPLIIEDKHHGIPAAEYPRIHRRISENMRSNKSKIVKNPTASKVH